MTDTNANLTPQPTQTPGDRPVMPLSRRLTKLLIIPVVAAMGVAFYGVIQLIQPTQHASSATVGKQRGVTLVDKQKINDTLDIARQHLRGNEAAKAEAILSELVAQYPAEQSPHLLYGEVLLTLGHKQEALDQYSTAVIIGPDHPEYRFAAGTIASELQLWDEASKHYTIARQLDPTNPKYPLYLGQVQRRLGQVDQARTSLADAVRLDKNLALGWGSLAAIAMDESKFEAALDYVARARTLQPDNLTWRLLEARILRRDNQAEKASELLYAIPEIERLSSQTIMNELAMCLGLMGKANDAAEMYLKATKDYPSAAEFAYQAGLWLERAGREAEANEQLRSAANMGHEAARALVKAEEKTAG